MAQWTPLALLALVALAGACTGRSTYKGGGREGELPPVESAATTPTATTTRDAGVRDTGAVRDTGTVVPDAGTE